jgi:excisionase family DNA binding protein
MHTFSPERELLTVAEVAMRLGVSSATVRRRIADGSLRAVRLGPNPTASPVRVPRSALEEWLGGGRT